MRHSAAWYDANLARCAAILTFLDEPSAAAEQAMHDACAVRQPSMFTAPPHAGLITGGQPELSGLADRGSLRR